MARALDQAALEQLYARLEAPMVNVIYRWVWDEAEAQDVVQDAFLKLVSGRYSINPGGEGPYLRSAVLNGARTQLRKRKVRRAKQPEPPGLVAAAEDDVVDAAERARIVAGLRKLPSRQAAVIVLRYYLDLSEREIAETLDIAPGSVKSHAHRGLRKLRAQLEASS